jgi:exopolyphosphatase / guanosine-5'-triphosphate,3'-diphosphate pyrophosphatase
LADQPLAVIDIGSNSGRMIVVRSPTGHHVETLLEAKTPLRLASDVAAAGSLTPGAFERTIACLEDFLAQARAFGAARTIAVATAAVRDASNGQALIDRIRSLTGLEVETIDGEREAELGFLGAVHSIPVDAGVLLDVGGGSIELSRFRDRKLARAWSLPLGALLLSDRFFTEDPPGRGERRRLLDHVTEAVQNAKVPDHLSRNDRLVGTGGTIRNLAKMDRRERSYPIARVHGYVLTLAKVDELAGLLSSRPLAKREGLSGLNVERADSIVAGAIVVRTIMEMLGAEVMTVSGKGLREGIAMEALTASMPSPVSVRDASLAALAARFATWDPERARRREALASEIFASTSSQDPEVAEMLRYAALVIDVGAALDPYNRHEHAAAAMLSGDLSGFSHPQLALTAAILRRADKEDAGLKPFRSLLRGYDPAVVTRAAVALAVADSIDLRLTPGASAATKTTKSTITVVGTLRSGRWSERLGARTKLALGRGLSVKTREDEP